jgi:hypothetical protein
MIEQLNKNQIVHSKESIQPINLQNINWKEIFDSSADSRKYNFYNHFYSTKLVNDLGLMLKSNIPQNEVFDEETGMLIANQEPTTEEQSELILQSLYNYTDNPESAKIFYIDKIPVVQCSLSDITPEYRDAGAFIIGTIQKPIAIGLVEDVDDMQSQIQSLQHEMVHMAAINLGLTNIEKVDLEYDENYLPIYDIEFEEYQITCSFVDEALAYGTNAFTFQKEFTKEEIMELFFYRESTIANFDLQTNAKQWAEIINQTIQDRSGKKQFKLNNFLIKHVKTIQDIDMANVESRNLLLRKLK